MGSTEIPKENTLLNPEFISFMSFCYPPGNGSSIISHRSREVWKIVHSKVFGRDPGYVNSQEGIILGDLFFKQPPFRQCFKFQRHLTRWHIGSLQSFQNTLMLLHDILKSFLRKWNRLLVPWEPTTFILRGD